MLLFKISRHGVGEVSLGGCQVKWVTINMTLSNRTQWQIYFPTKANAYNATK